MISTYGEVGAALPLVTPAQALRTKDGVGAGALRLEPSPYAELKARIKAAGLTETQPGYYVYKVASTLIALGISLALVVVKLPFWAQMLNAALLAAIFTQIGFLLHDVCHRALARRPRWNLILSLIFGNLLTGVSPAWWSDNHNAHHSHPNEIDLDPNIDIPILAYTAQQAMDKRGIARFIVKYQSWFLFPIFCLQGFNMLVQSVMFLRACQDKNMVRRELAVLVVHYVLYGTLIFGALGFWEGALFVVVHHGIAGLYAGSVFAPNHKGMPVLEKGTQVGFLHQQVLTSRNVKGHPLTDFFYGGLNYQIEHHLFPTMPRKNLGQAQVIVKTFCAAKNIDYCETGMLASYGEVLRHFNEVSAVLKTARATANTSP
jgi:fatty acid desaturase